MMMRRRRADSAGRSTRSTARWRSDGTGAAYAASVRDVLGRLPADLAYYVAYPTQTSQRPKVRAFRDWLFEEVGRST